MPAGSLYVKSLQDNSQVFGRYTIYVYLCPVIVTPFWQNGNCEIGNMFLWQNGKCNIGIFFSDKMEIVKVEYFSPAKWKLENFNFILSES